MKANSTKNISIGSLTMDYSKAKILLIKITLCVVIVDIVLFLYLYKEIFYPMSLAESASMQLFYEPLLGGEAHLLRLQEGMGVQTGELIVSLTKEKFTPKIMSTIIRSEFSVAGNLITLNKNNISVFEYENINIAEEEAMAYASKYNKSTKQDAWKEFTQVYTKGNIVILYLGNGKDIEKSLVAFAGQSLIK